MISIMNTNFHEGYKVMKVTRIVIMALMVAIGMTATSMGQVVPTNVWTDFGGTECTVNGEQVGAGSVIEAFDPEGILCGQRTVTAAGRYIGMPVYGDDDFTSGVDEGCESGDAVLFKIDGKVAYKLGPGSDIWSGLGPLRLMNLATSDITIFDLSVIGPDGGAGEAGTEVIYQVDVYNNGDGVDLVTLEASSQNGWSTSVDSNPDGNYIGAGEHITVEVRVSIPAGTIIGAQDILTLTAASRFNVAETYDKEVTTTVDESTDVADGGYAIPGQFSLGQNYPNPFNPETKIAFALDKTSDVTLEVFDILGRKVSTLHSGYLGAGQHEFTWYGVDQNGRQAASGIYFYRLSANEFNLTRKMTLLK